MLQITDLRIYHNTRRKGLFYANVRVGRRILKFEITVDGDGKIQIAKCDNKPIAAAITAAVELFIAKE